MKIRKILPILTVCAMLAIALSPGTKGAEWYNANWEYRIPITITNPSASALTNVTYKVDINPTDTSDFVFAYAQNDFDDIRFTLNDHTTTLSYWIEFLNYSWQDATLWVKVPSIGASSVLYGASQYYLNLRSVGVFHEGTVEGMYSNESVSNNTADATLPDAGYIGVQEKLLGGVQFDYLRVTGANNVTLTTSIGSQSDYTSYLAANTPSAGGTSTGGATIIDDTVQPPVSSDTFDWDEFLGSWNFTVIIIGIAMILVERTGIYQVKKNKNALTALGIIVIFIALALYGGF